MHSLNDPPYDERPWYQRRGLGFVERVHAVAFWCLILFLAGAVAGMAVAFKYHSAELSKATRLGCLIHDGTTYELKKR
jgi:hypothetical protein